jgi:hypothetical protein
MCLILFMQYGPVILTIFFKLPGFVWFVLEIIYLTFLEKVFFFILGLALKNLKTDPSERRKCFLKIGHIRNFILI